MNIVKLLQEELNIRADQVQAVIHLIDEGNTIPFIARYRKEQHGGLNDEVLRNLDERLRYLRNLESKKAQVISSIEEQGLLTEELRKKIEDAQTLVSVEDLYLPYRPKRRTRATMAKERGLEPLAALIRMQKLKQPLEQLAAGYIDKEKNVMTIQDALDGAKDILAEAISDNAEYRDYIRRLSVKEGCLVTIAKDETKESVYENYYNYREAVKSIADHRILAINRGEKEKFLNVKLEVNEEKPLRYLEKKILFYENSEAVALLKETIGDAYKRLIAPAIERDIRSELTERAEDAAIKVFGKNLEQLLMQPPIAGQVVLGWDPAFRTGCKLAVVDQTGKVLDTIVIYPTMPQNKVEEAKKVVKKLIENYQITLISVGNGTASRESELIIVDMLKEFKSSVKYIITNEAGASVYSASKLAAEEFPNFDVGQRSAISIARRVQDPLAELVKIDPKSIGVGQYQHDMNQKKLGEALNAVVEDCVNRVGVDLNTASSSLLEYISGISKTVAKNIVAYREQNGPFKNRKQLLKVPKLGPKAFEQCAGFLRINGGENALDATAVHPESYPVAEAILKKLGYCPEDILTGIAAHIRSKVDATEMEKLFKIGKMTLDDIIEELEKPARDPRDEMPKPILRSDVLEIKDLTPGMILKGTVRNVIDFGAFVDIGVHQDGLVHISEMSDRYVKHPMDVVHVGDIVEVKVLSVDTAKHRIQLTMKRN